MMKYEGMMSLEHINFLFGVSYQYWTIFFIWLLDTEAPAFKAFPSTVHTYVMPRTVYFD